MKTAYLLCIDADGYEVSLEARKVYARLPDAEAEEAGMVRVVDETEEDYLYPAERFVAIEVPEAAAVTFGRTLT